MGPGGEIQGVRKSKDNDATTPSVPSLSNTPMSFRIATEEMLDKQTTEASGAVRDSTYGVQSLQQTMYDGPSLLSSKGHRVHGEDEDSDDLGGRRRSTLKVPPRVEGSASVSASSVLGQDAHIQTGSSSPSRQGHQSPPPSMSHSLTSLSLDSQAPLSSLPSSPKSYSNRSLKASDEDSMDEAGSQPIISSSDDDAGPSISLQNSVPQLIMPSIKMPSRRPFTDRGKNMGRLKILIAGDSGVGKTSLIRSIVQTCEDIVHVDPISPSAVTITHCPPAKKSKAKTSLSNSKSTQLITEVHASTKPYPSWWPDIEDTKVLKKSKSTGDIVLERNLCFVDTPGYSSGMSKMEMIDLVLQYVEAQLKKSFSAFSSGEGDVVGLLSGSGGSQVDVVFYMIFQVVKHEDIAFLKRLTAVTNVIVLIAKSDTMSPEETEVLRRSISEDLRIPGLNAFQLEGEHTGQPPFTVCSAPSDDDDNMDASLLMSSDYLQPLIRSELGMLMEQIMDKDTASCLRHLSASKLVRARCESMPLTLSAPLQHGLSNPTSNQNPTSANPSSLPILQKIGSPTLNMSPYLQAKIADHTQQEEKLAQIRLAKWAADLQRSLQTERAKYETLARAERTEWLNDKLGEISNDSSSTLVKNSNLIRRPEKSCSSRRPGVAYQYSFMDAGDPLGLLQWNEMLRRRGWLALQVAGGFGILGAVAVWVTKTWSVDGHGIGDWNLNWWREVQG